MPSPKELPLLVRLADNRVVLFGSGSDFLLVILGSTLSLGSSSFSLMDLVRVC